VRGRDDLFVSMSHTDRLAAIAIARRPVGLDIEQLPTGDVDEVLVRRSFTEAELRSWARVAPSDRRTTFLRRWARKEAVLKALGGRDEAGRLAMDSLDVRRRAVLRQRRLWWLTDLELPPSHGHVGALVTAWAPCRPRICEAEGEDATSP
jgi:4'-phosphopantetheinyl transferase